MSEFHPIRMIIAGHNSFSGKWLKGQNLRVGIRKTMTGWWQVVALDKNDKRVNGYLRSWKTERTAKRKAHELADDMERILV